MPAAGRAETVAGVLSLAAVLLVAFNLRGSLAVVPPVLGDVRADLGLSRSVASLVTAVPVLCFGLLAPLASALGRRFRLDVVVLSAMALLGLASLVRSFGGTGGLVLGTCLIGAALTVGNVLVPVMVKRDFAHRAALVTGLYVTALTGGAAVAAAISVPIAHTAGWAWQGALAVWCLPAVLAALVVAAALRRSRAAVAAGPPAADDRSSGVVLRSSVAWGLAWYTAMQGLLFYTVLTWLPAVLVDEGVAPAAAGTALVLFTAVGVPAALLAPLLASGSDHRLLLVVPCGLWAAGLAGLLVAPQSWPVCALLLATGQGAGLSLGLAQVPLRAGTAGLTARLAAMTQSVGYVIAAGGPWLVAAVRDVSGGWTLPLSLLTLLCGSMAAAGVLVGRPDARVAEPGTPTA